MSKTDQQSNSPYPALNAQNEWDPLEEIIVGIVEEAMIQPWDAIVEATLHRKELRGFYRQSGGTPWPKELIDAAKRRLDESVHILAAQRHDRPLPHIL